MDRTLTQPRHALTAPRRTRVALVGFASSYTQAPYDDPSVEIWGLNELWKYLSRWDRWFELHPRDVFAKEGDRNQAAHEAWLMQQGDDRPIYMLQHFDDIPASIPYPLAAMTQQFFPDSPGGYWTSSIAFMLALAIAEGFEWIGLYGIDLAADVEYMNQRAAVEYLIGVARGLGRTVVVAPGSALLKSPAIYGYDQQPGQRNRPLSRTWLEQRLADLKTKHEKCLDTLHTLDGAIETTAYHLRIVTAAERGVQVEGEAA